MGHFGDYSALQKKVMNSTSALSSFLSLFVCHVVLLHFPPGHHSCIMPSFIDVIALAYVGEFGL